MRIATYLFNFTEHFVTIDGVPTKIGKYESKDYNLWYSLNILSHKFRYCSPCEKNHKTSISKVKTLNVRNLFTNKFKKILKLNLFPIPSLHNKKNFRPILRQKIWPIFPILAKKKFGPKLPDFFYLLSKVGMGNKLYFIKFFHSLLKRFCPFSDFTFESKVL